MRIQTKLLIAAAALIPALLACPPEAPPDPVVPKSAKVKSFNASPAQVEKRGDLVTLSWEVEDATSVTLTTASGQPIAVSDPTQSKGTVEVKVAETTVYLLTARGEGGTDAAATSVLAPSEAPAVLFNVFPDTVSAGRPATLVWNAPGASQITVTDGAGGTVVSGEQAQGSITVTPLFDTTYTLEADGRSFEVALKVTPGISELISDPTAVEPGGSVTVSWKAGGASKLTLSTVERGELTQTTSASEIVDGSFVDTVPADALPNGFVTYVLKAEKDGITAQRELKLWVGTDPLIEEFFVPAFAKEGETFTLSWKTQLATHAQIAVDGAVIYQAPSLAEAKSGTLTLPAPAPGTSQEVELRASNDRGGLATSRYTVAAVGTPALVDFSADHVLVAQGGDPIVLSWEVTNGRNVRIATSTGRTVKTVSGVSAESGSVTVYPNGPMEYVLFADNGVGESISPQPTVQVDVTSPAELTWSNGPVPVGAPIEVSGHTVNGGGAILGLPHVVKNAPGESFVDISQTGTAIELVSDFWGDMPHLISFAEPFDSTVYGVSAMQDSVAVAVEGWLVFAPDVIWGATDNTGAWPGKGLAPLAIAPWFDDLQAKQDGSSRLYHQVDGAGLDQRLIVQWSHVEHAMAPGSDLTFQAQIHANGKIVFAYQTLQGVGMEIPSVGVIDRHEQDGVVPQDVPAEGETLTFFGEITPPLTITASEDPYFVRVRIGASDVIEIVDSADVIPPGALTVSEINANPAVANGQWFELTNHTASPFDLTGWTIDFGGSTHAITGTVAVPAQSSVVFAQAPGAGDGLTVFYEYGTAHTLAPGASVALQFAGGTYDALAAPATLPAGVTWQAGPAAAGMETIAPDVQLSCMTRAVAGNAYGTHGQYGTPGVASGACPNYAAPVEIAGAFESIAATGTLLTFPINVDMMFPPEDEGMEIVQLTAPVIIDGTPHSQILVGTNGFISLDATLQCDDLEGCFRTNKTALDPSTGPVGLIAPYWDDLAPAWGGNGGVYVERKSNYTIVSWEDQERMEVWSPPWFPPVQLNFQVKFFDNGDLEFHYGANDTDGTSSTTWFEHASGKAAFILNAESDFDGFGSNVGYRFAAQ